MKKEPDIQIVANTPRQKGKYRQFWSARCRDQDGAVLSLESMQDPPKLQASKTSGEMSVNRDAGVLQQAGWKISATP
ncbi:MAG: hypothetical protein D6816_10430 [Bacteroidetes bacterium]|nr:MAG: hypothetical protein D6816_10430 [Bacteroidota bacterium]